MSTSRKKETLPGLGHHLLQQAATAEQGEHRRGHKTFPWPMAPAEQSRGQHHGHGQRTENVLRSAGPGTLAERFVDWLSKAEVGYSSLENFDLMNFLRGIEDLGTGRSRCGGFIHLEIISKSGKRYRVYIVSSQDQLPKVLPRREIDESKRIALKVENQLCYIFEEK